MQTDQRIPVTILTGFLGAGKTTLLNNLIKNNPDRKFAVIENEFGEIPIDNELVQQLDEGVFEMSNGCLCCTLNDDLAGVLEKILRNERKIDHVLLETTGIADPGPVAMTFIADQMVQHYFRLNAIVALADVRYIENQLENQEEACRQIASADFIILNKSDLAEPYLVETAGNIIKKMNPLSPVVSGKSGVAEGYDILNLNSFNQENIKKNLDTSEQKLDLKVRIKSPVSAAVNLAFKPGFVHRHSEIRSFSFEFSEPVDLLKFDIWSRYLINENRGNLYRIKGILSFHNIPQKVIFQAVNDSHTTTSGGEWSEGEVRNSRIVFIGKKLDGEKLRNALKACVDLSPFDPEKFYKAIS
jgi:G3E family GTPase